MATKKVLIPLATGFEEIEAVTIIDVLRRAGVEVITAGLGHGLVHGSHKIALAPDCRIDDVASGNFDMIALPGGMPGATHLRDHPRLQQILREAKDAGRWTAAICAAPMALGPSEITEGHAVTSYPGFADQFPHARYLEDRVVVDRTVITSRGPGTALEFALTLVEKLCGAEKARELAGQMLVHRPAPAREMSA